MSNEVVVRVNNVTKRFGERVIFESVSLDVKKSEVVAIVGPSGAGKSTFIRCINHLHAFDGGSIEVLGHVLVGGTQPTRAELQQLNSKVGMVFQTFNLFPHLTVLDNIILAPMQVKKIARQDATDQAMNLLKMVGLQQKAQSFPKSLSGGEQQRVAICRALAMEPELMLFDEPTSMLDPELVGEVLEFIQRLAGGGMTMLLVTHEMMFAKDVADTVVIMADGGIAEKGPARQVLEAPRTERARSFLRRVLSPMAHDDRDLVANGGDET